MNIGQIAKMAQQMQTQMAQAQAELKEMTLEATAGGGAVEPTCTVRKPLCPKACSILSTADANAWTRCSPIRR